jgi:hypothetical protein
MSSRGILSSPYQRRVIVTFSLVAIAALLLSVILLNAGGVGSRRKCQ